MLVGGFARTVEAAYLLRSGWAQELAPPRDLLRERVTVAVSGAADADLARDPHGPAARIPRQAHQAIAAGLESGPVLVQTPRTGYVPSLACERCRTPARCTTCHGPLALRGPTAPPALPLVRRRPTRPGRAGSAATAGCGRRCSATTAPPRSWAGRSPGPRSGPPATTGSGRPCPDRPEIVVATPGAEPVAEAGYAVVVLLDTWLSLARADLRTAEESLRRWANAVGLVRPGGRVLAVGDPAHPALQALVRWDMAGFAERETRERLEAHLPPASRLATIAGEPGAVDDALTLLAAPDARRDPRPGRPRRRREPGRRPGAARRRARPCRWRSASSSGSARAASSTPSGSRSTRPVSRLGGSSVPVARSPVAIRPIRLFGDPILRRPALEVVDFDKELRTLVADLTDTMLDAPGAGLAAPQIGVGLRAFTWYVDGEPGHLINPVLDLSEEIQDGPEGCLSLPELTYDCKRALSVVARGFNMHGDPVTIEGSELLARAIQHETDHLDGILFIDKLDTDARKAAMKAIRESDWFGAEQPRVRVSPHATNGFGL